jgi:hypothetical protein
MAITVFQVPPEQSVPQIPEQEPWWKKAWHAFHAPSSEEPKYYDTEKLTSPSQYTSAYRWPDIYSKEMGTTPAVATSYEGPSWEKIAQDYFAKGVFETPGIEPQTTEEAVNVKGFPTAGEVAQSALQGKYAVPENTAQRGQRYSEALEAATKSIQEATGRVQGREKSLQEFLPKMQSEMEQGRKYTPIYEGGELVGIEAGAKRGEEFGTGELGQRLRQSMSWRAPGSEGGIGNVFTPRLDKWKASQSPEAMQKALSNQAMGMQMTKPTPAQRLVETTQRYETPKNIKFSPSSVVEGPSKFTKPTMTPYQEVLAKEKEKKKQANKPA